MHRIALFAILAGCGQGVTFAEPKAAPAPEESAEPRDAPAAIADPGEAPTASAPAPDGPVSIDGAVAHPASRASLDPELRGLVDAFEAAMATEPTPPKTRSSKELNRWSQQTLKPFIAEHRKRLTALERRGAVLMKRPDPADRKLVAVMVARSWERLVQLFEGLPAPASVEADPDLLEAYRGALRTTVVPIAHRAGDVYAACAALPSTPATEVWHRRCEDRAGRLRSREASPPATPSDRGGGAALEGTEAPPVGTGGLVPCTSDAQCRPNSRCEPWGAAVDDGDAPVRVCTRPR